MVVIFSFLIFLYFLYIFSRDDFIFLRKNVNTYQLFDLAFLTGLTALICSRIFFVIFHFKFLYLNPLAFFMIPYFPGLSLCGAILGGIIFLFFSLSRKKMPVARVFDVYTLSFISATIVHQIISGIIALLFHNFILVGVLFALSLILLIITFFLSINFLKALWKDGLVTCIGLCLISMLFIILQIALDYIQKRIFTFSLESMGLLLLSVLIIGITLFGRRGVTHRSAI